MFLQIVIFLHSAFPVWSFLMQPPMSIPWTHPPQGSLKIRRHLDVESWGVKIVGFVNLHLFFFFEHDESLLSKIWSTVNFEGTGVLFLYYFVYLKVNLNLEKINQLGESSTNFIFAAVNLDPIILENRWTEGKSWPNDFVGNVNRGEDLRWVGSRCPLTRA